MQQMVFEATVVFDKHNVLQLYFSIGHAVPTSKVVD